MAKIKPFAALRPKPDLARQVASRPYDVLNTAEAREEARDNPYSFLRVTRSEIDLPEGVDVHSEPVYKKAAANLDLFRQNGVLFRESEPSYYIYQLGMNGRTQTGLVCVSSVEDYHNDIIKKHEFTRPEKEKDRIDHMKALRAQTGNVFMACRDVKELQEIFDQVTGEAPLYDLEAEDGVHHSIWRIPSSLTEEVTRIFAEKVPATYIADGHHRAASAAKVSNEFPDNEEAKYFLTTIFPASQLAIMDYNRVVKDLNGLKPAELLKNLETDFELEKLDSAYSPRQPREFGMYLDGNWYKLTARKGTWTDDPIGTLDVTILTNRILEKWLGIGDQRTDKRVDFVGGIRGMKALEKLVDSGDMKVAFSLYPVSIHQLFAIADSGKVMPPKTTWFEPKLRDGLLTHVFQA